MPSKSKNENKEKIETKKKSFVRISPKTRAKAAAKTAKLARAIEPEIMDDDERDEQEEKDFDIDDVIDVGDNQLPIPITHDAEIVDEDTPDEKSLVVPSSLQRYMTELRRYPLMTREEEQAVGRKAYETGDIESKNRLVTANLRLVVKIAMEYRRAYAQMLDLIQEGNAGLVQAVNRFNPYRGVKLSTYAAWWIRAYILKFLMDNKSMVRMGTTEAQRKLFFRLRSEAEKMYALTQRFDANLLAEKIGVKESDVVEMQERLTKSDMSLDAPLGTDSENRQIDLLPSEGGDAYESAEKEQLLKILRKEVKVVEKDLNDRELYIFQNRILADDPITLQEVGDKYGITRERARQLEARIMKKIKERLVAAGMGK